jgi:hypothetical protein
MASGAECELMLKRTGISTYNMQALGREHLKY